MRIRRTEIDIEDEKNLIIGLIVSTHFCKTFLPIIKKEYLRNDYSWTITRWIIEYYNQYEEAPNKNIQDIYNVKKEHLDETLAEIIGKFLKGLSDLYEQSERFNEIYLSDRVSSYLRKRSLISLRDRITGHITIGDVEEGEIEIANYKKVVRATSDWENPFEDKNVEEVLLKEHQYLMHLPGALGEIIGPLKRTWFVALMGPMKRGKTWWLDEFKFAALTNRLKVVSISLEMIRTETSLRSYKRISGRNEDRGGDWIIPVFDCVRNQEGSCDREERENTEKLLNEGGEIPEYREDMTYKPCTWCSKRGIKSFIPAVWYDTHRVEQLAYGSLRKKIKAFETMYGKDLLRTKSYPMNTASLSDIDSDLDILEYSEGFIPDVIIIDYMDILKKEDSRVVGRDAINDTWKAAKRLAQRRGCLFVSVTQSNRESMERYNVKQIHTGEDIRKLAHVDVFGVLNQTDTEKRSGVMRFGLIAHRHKYFDFGLQIQVLQQLKLGQPFLDAVILRKEDD
jgi:hypothetical protein